MEQRILAMEGTVGNLPGQLNTFSGEITRLLKIVEDNDTGIKQIMQTQITGIQAQISGVDQTYQSAGIALEGRLTQASTALETRLTATEGMTNRVSTLESASLQSSRDLVNMADGIKTKVAELEQALLTAGANTGPREKREFEGKPLMEYKMIEDLGKLTNDKSGFRDWTTKTKDVLLSIYRDDTTMEILENIEDPATKWTGSETMGESYDDAELNGITCEKDKWEKWGREIKSLVMQKADEKSEAFLLAKKAKCGWSACYALNKWYSAVSGEGLSQRVTNLMKPKQSQRDEDVVHDVEKWMDEFKECRAWGASEMPYDYMYTAIRGIATPFIQGQMDIADAGADQSDKKGRWQKGYDTLMNWARRKMIEGGNKNKSADVNMGQLAPEYGLQGYGKKDKMKSTN